MEKIVEYILSYNFLYTLLILLSNYNIFFLSRNFFTPKLNNIIRDSNKIVSTQKNL